MDLDKGDTLMCCQQENAQLIKNKLFRYSAKYFIVEMAGRVIFIVLILFYSTFSYGAKMTLHVPCPSI